MLDLPPHHTPRAQEEEDDREEEEEEEEEEEIPSHAFADETQEVFAQSQKRRIEFGDDGNLIKASTVEVDCSG